MHRILAASALALALAAPAHADEVSDALDSAQAAYAEGDIQFAIEEISFALQRLNEMKADTLSAFLPEALDGWSREIDPDIAAGMGAMGGGAGAQAEYTDGTTRFTITLMADNPMVAAMSGMLANPAIAMASGGRMIRVGREKFVSNDGQLMTLIGNRVLVQAEGADDDILVRHLETMDFGALAGFGS